MKVRLTTMLALLIFWLLASALPAFAGWKEDYRAALNAGNQQRALLAVEGATLRGDAEAEFTMGLLYHAGQLVPQDDEKGYAWMLAGVEHGFIRGKSSAEGLEKRLSAEQRERGRAMANRIRGGRIR
jgi:TPR repeat protein